MDSESLCSCCKQPLDTGRTCPVCLQTARSLLIEIVLWHRELPRHLGHLKASAGGGRPGGADGRPLPGGDILVLMGPGSPGYSDTGETRRTGDPVSVEYGLGCWADAWRAARGEVPATRQPVWAAAQYLRTHSRWASESFPAFPEFLGSIRDMHGRLERATGRRRNPTRANSPCFNCGGVLRRLVDPHGLEHEHVTCETCLAEYSPAEYAQALRAATTTIFYDGEDWKPADVLAAQVGRSRNTLASWRASGLVRSHSWGGMTFLSVSDVDTQHHLRSARK